MAAAAACCGGSRSEASSSSSRKTDKDADHALCSAAYSPRPGSYPSHPLAQLGSPISSPVLISVSPSSITTTSMPPPAAVPSTATASPSSTSSLPVRSACEACRDRKLKCDGVKGPGGCGRCQSDGVACVYTSRKPIGRPKKRRTEGGTPDAGAAGPRPTKMRPLKSEPADGTPSIGSPALSMRPSPSSLLASPSESGPSSMDMGSWPPHLVAAHPPPPPSMLVAPPPAPPPTADDSPTLSDLSVAAFLNSLDTLEIGRDDGLTPGMLSQWPGMSSGGGQSGLASGVSAPGAAAANGSYLPGNALSLSGAALHDGSSFAVPSDFSWWNPGFLVDFQGRAPGERVESGVGGSVEDELRGGASRVPVQVKQGSPSPQPTAATSSTAPPAKSCCCSSSKGEAKGKSSELKAPPPRAPSTSPQAASLNLSPDSNSAHQQHASSSSSSSSSSRIHCVPNPSGKGCTCLCDVSVALINVRGRLKHAADGSSDDQTAATLQLTLSASQAVAAQCACSADCPTCRSDPSTAVTSASLLVSTALQIYARAVDTLRKSFGGGGAAAASTSGGGHSPHPHGDAANTWSIRIGDYKPSARNARRIALLAIGLELRDLSDALQKVRRAAEAGSVLRMGDDRGTSPGPGDESSGESGAAASSQQDSWAAAQPPMPPLLSAIDHLVIKKLHQQVEEMLHTIEALEGGARDRDRERERERQGERLRDINLPANHDRSS